MLETVNSLWISVQISETVYRSLSSIQNSDASIQNAVLNFAQAKFGARQAIVEEPLTWCEEYPIVWRELKVKSTELAGML